MGSEGEMDKLWSAVFDAHPDSLIVSDAATGRVLLANAAAYRETGYSKEALLKRTIADLFAQKYEEDNLAETRDIDFLCSADQDSQYLRRADRTLCPVEVKSGEISHGSSAVVLTSWRDNTERKRAHELLLRLSLVDPLTGIANRRSFETSLDLEWRRAARTGSALSLIMVDVDFFKSYNDTCGHQAGDDCLKQVARAMTDVVKRPGDLVARYGGEEFAVLLQNTAGAGAMLMAEKMRAHVESLGIAHPASAVMDRITISLGVASAQPEPHTSPGALVAAADEALYRSKQDGRNRVSASAGGR